MTTRILLPTDGSRTSLPAVEYLRRLLRHSGEQAEITLARVDPRMPPRAARVLARAAGGRARAGCAAPALVVR
jgi:hypothetical protein